MKKVIIIGITLILITSTLKAFADPLSSPPDQIGAARNLLQSAMLQTHGPARLQLSEIVAQLDSLLLQMSEPETFQGTSQSQIIAPGASYCSALYEDWHGEARRAHDEALALARGSCVSAGIPQHKCREIKPTLYFTKPYDQFQNFYCYATVTVQGYRY